MAQRKLTMRKSKEILRPKWNIGLNDRQVAASLRIAHANWVYTVQHRGRLYQAS